MKLQKDIPRLFEYTVLKAVSPYAASKATDGARREIGIQIKESPFKELESLFETTGNWVTFIEN